MQSACKELGLKELRVNRGLNLKIVTCVSE